MTSLTTSPKKEETVGSSFSHSKTIEKHKKAAAHHEAAAKEHLQAAKHHEAGEHDKAFENTVKAHGYHCLANDQHRELSKSNCNC